MNAWSSTLTGGHINSNAALQAGWTGSVWPEAAEIIRYAYDGWSAAAIARFENMLATQYVPNLINGARCKNGLSVPNRMGSASCRGLTRSGV